MKINIQDESYINQYISSVYFILATITTVCYGDITGNSNAEIIFQMFLLIIGTIAYSFVISYFSNYIIKINQKSMTFQKNVSILEEIRLYNPLLKDSVYHEVLKNLHNELLYERKDKSLLFDCLPYTLKNKLIMEMYRPFIDNFIFFKDTENSDFIVKVITSLKPLLSFKGDILVQEGDFIKEIFFVKRGSLCLNISVNKESPEESIRKYLGVNEDGKINISFSPVIINSYKRNSVFNFDDNINNYLVNKKKEKEKEKDNCKINLKEIKLLEIRKNEHFGVSLMFLNERSPLTVKVKTKVAELLILKKMEAIEIHSIYPNIWKRINKKSLYNLEQIKLKIKQELISIAKKYGSNAKQNILKKSKSLKKFINTSFTNINESQRKKNKKKKKKNIKNETKPKKSKKNVNKEKNNIIIIEKEITKENKKEKREEKTKDSKKEEKNKNQNNSTLKNNNNKEIFDNDKKSLKKDIVKIDPINKSNSILKSNNDNKKMSYSDKISPKKDSFKMDPINKNNSLLKSNYNKKISNSDKISPKKDTFKMDSKYKNKSKIKVISNNKLKGKENINNLSKKYFEKELKDFTKNKDIEDFNNSILNTLNSKNNEQKDLLHNNNYNNIDKIIFSLPTKLNHEDLIENESMICNDSNLNITQTNQTATKNEKEKLINFFCNLSTTKIYSFQLSSSYENLNEITNNKYIKDSFLQSKTKQFLLKEYCITNKDSQKLSNNLLILKSPNENINKSYEKNFLNNNINQFDLDPDKRSINSLDISNLKSTKRINININDIEKNKKEKNFGSVIKESNKKVFSHKASIKNILDSPSSKLKCKSPKKKKNDGFGVYKQLNIISKNIKGANKNINNPNEFYMDFFNSIIKKEIFDEFKLDPKNNNTIDTSNGKKKEISKKSSINTRNLLNSNIYFGESKEGNIKIKGKSSKKF